MMKKIPLFFLIPSLALAVENAANKITVPGEETAPAMAAAEPSAPLPKILAPTPAAPVAQPGQLSSGDRNDLYEEYGMDYAKKLYMDMSGSPEDELRSRKTEALNYQIRERGIKKLEEHLTRTKDARIKKEIHHRLSQMFETQAEIVTRRSDVKDKEGLYRENIIKSNKHLLALRSEFSNFSPDTVIFNLAENYSKLKDYPAAERHYRDVIARFPNSPVVADSLLSLGNLYFERQGFQTARGFYTKILNTPEQNLHPYAHYKMAWCYFNENNLEDAVNGLELAIKDSRKIQNATGQKKLGVEEEALSDLVLFYAEYGKTEEAKAHFARLVDKDKSQELRFQLAKRLYDYGKHQLAQNVAQDLLKDNPNKEYVNKLYLILISVAERTKDREMGLKTAEKLSGWLKKENLAATDTGRIESEEYLRGYSEKLHHEAETLKQKDLWAQAKKSYEIYLNTFPNETETGEVKFRYSVLLMNRKEQLNAYKMINEAIEKMAPNHSRFKEALKLRIQSIELATANERKQMSDKERLIAYDVYAQNYPTEDLGVEAQFKAANIAKNIETPEQVAARFRMIAEKNPKHSLAKAAVSEALATLVKAQKWEALGAESKLIGSGSSIQANLLDGDESLRKKISEARELSQVKITENLESQGKLEEAREQYEKILADNPSETMGIYSYVRLATLAEQKMNKNLEAIKYFEGLKKKYPSSKEARQASLELARLYEKVNQPREAVRRYMEYSSSGRGKLEQQALTNAAVILEHLGDREPAADAFFRLSEVIEENKGSAKEIQTAYEEGCNNILLASHKNKDKKVLEGIHACAKRLSASSGQSLLWQARGAWAMDQMADGLQADESWKKLAGKSLKATPEAERAYVAMAKLKLLNAELANFKTLRFAEKNERPEANIGNKTQALDKLEKMAESIIKVGTPKQILGAKSVLNQAYLDFAEAMETAATPSKLNDVEKAELKKSFNEFAKNFREKAKSFEQVTIASSERNPASDAEPAFKLASLSGEEEKWLENGMAPQEKAAEVYAKKAFELFQDGKYGDARYFSEKWKKQLEVGSAAEGYGKSALEKFQTLLGSKLSEADPVSSDF